MEMRLLVSAVLILVFTMGTHAAAEEGWLKVYLGDSDRNQVSVSGSCTIVITPKAGKKSVLKAELVKPQGNRSGGDNRHVTR